MTDNLKTLSDFPFQYVGPHGQFDSLDLHMPLWDNVRLRHNFTLAFDWLEQRFSLLYTVVVVV